MVPAQAGVILGLLVIAGVKLGGPRTGGGDPKPEKPLQGGLRWSPHRRG